MKKQKIRIGVIGIGYLGKFHLEKFQKNKDCQLVWLIDKNIKNLKNYKDKYNVSTNYKEIVNDVDAVSIVTPTVNHYEIARYFIEKNNISYCSTGGGAFLEFMEGKELPSLSALGFKF